nr:MAG TPA: hypothetical protein [Caudoviricetes sp.]
MLWNIFLPFFCTFSKCLHEIFEICICHEKFVNQSLKSVSLILGRFENDEKCV